MKKSKLLIALIIPFICGCAPKFDFEENQVFEQTNIKGPIGDFTLLAPADNAEVTSYPTFTWTEAENAVSYTIEVCQLDSFIYNLDSVIYMKQDNIVGTSYSFTSGLKTKNIDYYWRVTAVNPFNNNTTGKQKVSEVKSFTFKSDNVEEIPISVGEEGDWTLHKDGSYADISIDKNNFFGNGDPNSLKITFAQEDTKQGIESSDGWIVVTKPLERDFYGTDSMFLNFYYSGDDAEALIRLIDADGEYWYTNIQISRDAKQTVLLRFEDFILRTKDTTVQNEIFNYEHIQNIEVVFEHSFGDGCCYVGNIRAVNFNNYKNLFITSLDYNSIPVENWIDDTYKFGKTISEDGKELILEYTTTAGFNGNEKGIGGYGYGFAKIPLECYFFGGNALRVKIKYTGYRSNVKSVIRVYEEDKDRWSYEQPFTQLKENEYTELTIPFAAFAKSEMRGDGKRQFYYIRQLQLGVSGVYGSGTISYKDIEIVSLPQVYENPKQVGEDGIIENFDLYTDRTEIYSYWENSLENKDEGIFLNSQEKLAVANNVNAGQFNYKSDMNMATYDIYTDVSYEDGNAIKVSIKDGTTLKSGEPSLSYLKDEDVAPTITLQIALKDGRWYRYVIEKAPKKWTEYTILFSDFTLNQGIELETSTPVLSQYVVNFAFGLQYFYYDSLGNSHPVYTESNPVYFDDIKFAKASSTKITALEKELTPVEGKILIDDFEYESEEDLLLSWMPLNGLDFENIDLSNEVSSKGGQHSMKLDYNGNSSPSYAIFPTFSSDAQAKALQLDIKGDDIATLYINIYIKNGTGTKQYRYTISNVSSSWNRYVIGFDNTLFSPMVSTDAPLDINSIKLIHRITFGIVGNTGGNVSSVYIDNIIADATVRSFLTQTVTPII